MFAVEIFQTTLAKLTAILIEHKIRYHLTGGLTGAAYVEPRMTQDIDIVIDSVKAKARLEELVASFASSDFLL